MATVQLNVRVEQALAKRLRKAAKDRRQTPGALVTQALELLLAAPSAEAAQPLATPSPALAEALAALEQRVEALEQQRAPRPARAPKPKAEPQPAAEPRPPIAPAGAITTAELAELLNIKRGSFNERLRRAGGARVGLEVEGWRCVGQGPGPNGGPSRWLWERAQ